MTPDERDFVLADVEASWIAYQALLDGISETDLARPMTVGVWSGKDVVAHIATWESACADVVALLRSLDPADWERETELPGWDVRAVAAHLAHLESELAGRPQEQVEVPEEMAAEAARRQEEQDKE